MCKPDTDVYKSAPPRTDRLGAGELVLTSEAAQTVSVDQVPAGTRLVVETANREYLIETCGGLSAFLQGHPGYCPEPVPVYVRGSGRRGFTPQQGSIRCGMRVDFWDPARGVVITTSRVRRVLLVLAQARC
jgi:hypothetical protein